MFWWRCVFVCVPAVWKPEGGDRWPGYSTSARGDGKPAAFWRWWKQRARSDKLANEHHHWKQVCPRVCVCVCVYTVCYWSSSVKVQVKICERRERDLQDTHKIKIDDPSCLSCPINSRLSCLWIGVWPILLAVASRLLSLRRRARSRGRRNLTLISKPPERRSWRRVRIPPTSWRRTTRNTATTTTTCWLVREDSIHHRCRCDLHGQNTCVCPNWDHISC